MKSKSCKIYTDGSSLGNPGPGGWGAILLFGENQVFELGGSADRVTNNQMELTAPLMALHEAKKRGLMTIELYSDSKYFLNGITKWAQGWSKNGWLTKEGKPVQNREIWMKLVDIVKNSGFKKTEFHHIKGHSGHRYNERADEIATGFAKKELLVRDLFDGESDHAFDHVTDQGLNSNPESSKIYKKPIYVTYDGREVNTYDSWPACENYVKGRRGIKFKKVKNEHELNTQVRKWKSGL